MQLITSRAVRTVLISFLTILATALAASAQPAFTKTFVPDTIGPGSVSTLRFDITNDNPVDPVSDLDFVDNLPAGVTIATPANATSSCGGTLSAPDGGGTITLSNGVLGVSSVCTIAVDVTSGVVGTHTNTSGDLTSSAGNSGTASDDLMVADDRPGFTKVFSPTSVGIGGRSTLTFTIDNSLNGSLAHSLTFVDNLPPGIVVADPPNVGTDCTGGQIVAPPGGSTVQFSPLFAGDAAVGANSTCTVFADVIGAAVGSLGNSSGELTSTVGVSQRSSGKANAGLNVTATTITVVKSFTDDPVVPGITSPWSSPSPTGTVTRRPQTSHLQTTSTPLSPVWWP